MDLSGAHFWIPWEISRTEPPAITFICKRSHAFGILAEATAQDVAAVKAAPALRWQDSRIRPEMEEEE
jgi:hypothetical protein